MHVIFNKEQTAISFCSNKWESEIKTDAAYISKMLITIYQTVWWHIPELTNIHLPRHFISTHL